MTRVGRSLGVVVGCCAAAVAVAQPAARPAAPMPVTAPTRVVLSDVVEPAHRDAVLGIVRRPTLSTKGTTEDVVCSPELFRWLLDHPDRVALAWRRLKVPCLEIADLGKGRFGWADGEGSDVVWQTVGTFPEGRVWYASGKVKAAAVAPTVPVKAVVVLSHPSRPLTDKASAISPAAQAFVQSDSKAANVVLRVLGPTAPKVAEDAAEQLLFFFAGVARYIQAHPERAEELLAPAGR